MQKRRKRIKIKGSEMTKASGSSVSSCFRASWRIEDHDVPLYDRCVMRSLQ
jgi:hypothetical protein